MTSVHARPPASRACKLVAMMIAIRLSHGHPSCKNEGSSTTKKRLNSKMAHLVDDQPAAQTMLLEAGGSAQTGGASPNDKHRHLQHSRGLLMLL